MGGQRFSQVELYSRYIIIGVLFWLFFSVYLLRLDSVVGMMVDDAWYVLLGKAIARGDGFTLINSPTEGIRPFIPPGFPALLSIVFLISPDFPENLWMLKSVSIVSMLAGGIMVFRYFHAIRLLGFYTALGIAAGLALYPGLVFFATATVMSECVYTMLQIAAICVIERGLQKSSSPGYAAAAGVIAGLAFLVRPAGAGLIAGMLLYLIIEKRYFKALLVGIILAMVIGPWMINARIHAPTPGQRAEVGANIIRPYSEQFLHRVAGVPSEGLIGLGDLPSRVFANLSETGRFGMGAVPLYFVFRGLEPGEVVRLRAPEIAISLLVSLLVLAGYFSVAQKRMTTAEYVVPISLSVSLLWGWEQFRFVLPLVPFLIFYLFVGVRTAAGLVLKQNRERGPAISLPVVIVWMIVASHLYANVLYISRQYGAAPGNALQWHGAFRENLELIEFADRNLPPDTVIATQNPALVYLFTDRKTVGTDNPLESREAWERLGVRFIVQTSLYPIPYREAIESGYRIIYRQPGRLGLRVVDLGPVKGIIR